MDPDSEAGQYASKIIQTTLISLLFTACQDYETEKTRLVQHAKISLPDSAKVKRESTVKKKKKKTIFLTFDDGPNKGTQNVLDIVKEEDLKVTFFIIGEHVYGSAAQRATYDSLLHCDHIEIANHSFTHAHNHFEKFYAVPDSAVKDFMRCADSLHLTARIIRTPGRNIWRTSTVSSTDIRTSASTADSLYKNGFTAVGWDLEWRFNNQLELLNTADEMIKKVDSVFSKGQTKTPDCLVILAHDQVYSDSGDSLELHGLMQKLKMKDEYDFDVISNYPGISKD